MANIHELVSIIGETQHYFKHQASRQVDTALTLRNWLFGYYIAEYELNGADRAEYGQKLFKEIANRLEKQGFRQIRERHLYLCKDFYTAYPNILRTVSAKLYLKDLQQVVILRTATAKLISSADSAIETPNSTDLPILQTVPGKSQIDIDKLINQLSFSHIIELLKSDSPLKRSFYEKEAVTNCWSVRELQRAMNSMLFERTGLSTNKKAVIDKQEFTHADAGQMNVYLNYYRENETHEGDNPPIGIILCASKNENLVKYATTGLPQQVFVNKYMLNLPQETELQKIIEEEQRKITNHG